jgi:hypothetical protein
MSIASSLLARFVVAFALVAPCAADESNPAPPDSPTAVRYHGFSIDLGHADARIDEDYPSLARQIAIVEAVDAPPAVKSFFASVPIHVEATLPRPPGEFVATPRGGYVRILAQGMPSDRPILLHELLHAYQADVIGRKDATIAAAFTAAREASDYPPAFRRAHFLENGSEYFAVTTSIFLFGPIKQPPFDCGVLAKTQPDYLAFLAKNFGPHACGSVGG